MSLSFRSPRISSLGDLPFKEECSKQLRYSWLVKRRNVQLGRMLLKIFTMVKLQYRVEAVVTQRKKPLLRKQNLPCWDGGSFLARLQWGRLLACCRGLTHRGPWGLGENPSCLWKNEPTYQK